MSLKMLYEFSAQWGALNGILTLRDQTLYYSLTENVVFF